MTLISVLYSRKAEGNLFGKEVRKMKMSNACESIERLARESEQRKLLAIAKDCKELSEFIDKLNAILLEK